VNSSFYSAGRRQLYGPPASTQVNERLRLWVFSTLGLPKDRAPLPGQHFGAVFEMLDLSKVET
jgi:hypothetical protein